MTIQTQAGKPASFAFGWLREVGNAAIDLLFPPRCVACQRHGAWLCPNCLAEVETIHPPICVLCGLPLASNESLPEAVEAACERCRQHPSQLDGLRSYAFHGGHLRLAIHQLKYEDLRAVAVPLGQLMGQGWATLRPPDLDIDAIVPVPLHAERQRQRGYNQAALLARALGSQLQRPVVEDVLARTKPTASQVHLDLQERRVNVRGAFVCTNRHLAGKGVLLIDDVYTTGSTLEAAANALRDGGVSSVWAYTLARAR